MNPAEPKEPRLPNVKEQQQKEDAVGLMQKARRSLLIRHPFIGSLAMRLKLQPVIDCRMNSACTDGRKLFADAEFFQRLTPEQQTAVIGHEVWHCALRHALRKQNREMRRFNYAADVEVDSLLKQDGFDIDVLPHRPEWLGRPAEYIYDELPQFVKDFPMLDHHLFPPEHSPFPPPIEPELPPASEPPTVSGRTHELPPEKEPEKPASGTLHKPDTQKPDSGEQAADVEDGKLDVNGEKNGKDAPPSAGGSGSSGGIGSGGNGSGSCSALAGCAAADPAGTTGGNTGDESPAPQGMSWQISGSDSVRPNYPLISRDFVCDPDFTGGTGDPQKTANDWKNYVRHEYHRCKGCGSLPGHIQQHLQAEYDPQVDWKKVLLDFITLQFKGEYQWLPPNRRFIHCGLYLPGQSRKKSIELAVALDTSGSTAEELPQFLAELQEMTASFGDYRITVIQCDCEIHNVEVFDNFQHPFDGENMTFHGSGGTSLIPPFRYVEKEKLELAVLIYLTDGCGPAPEESPPYPVIWCITPEGTPPVDWGIIVKMPERSKNDD